MSKDIVWSEPALVSLQEVFDYTYDTFGARQVPIIAEKIDKTIERLSIFPCSAPRLPYEIPNRELHTAVVIKPLKILYEIDGNALKIHFVWDARMDVPTILERIRHEVT